MTSLKALIALLGMTLSSSALADVEFQKLGFKDSRGREYASLKLTEHIQESDVAVFKKYIRQVHKQHLRLENDSVELNSHGGDGLAAVAIGRIIRKEHFSTIVPEESVCRSACVQVLISGVCRMALGEVSIHRSLHQSDEDMDKPVSISENYEVIKKERREKLSFYHEMGANPAMAWHGINTPQWLLTTLSEEEKDLYGLFYSIPEEQDLRFNRIARQRKVTKQSLVELLADQYAELNPEHSTSEVINHIACSEQLLLSE